MERASRLIVLVSAALAAVAHGWLTAAWAPTLWIAALAAFAITFVVARVSLKAALGIVLGSAYVVPALLSLIFGPGDYLVILVWLAAAAGPIVAHADVTRWHLPGAWTIPLVGWALVIAISWPVVAAREVDFSLVAARTLDTSQGIFAGSPPVAAAYVTVFALPQLLGILWIDLLWARCSGRAFAAFQPAVVGGAIAGLAASSLVGLYQALGDITWMNPAIWSSENRAGGMMLDANTFGTGAAMWAPIAIAASWSAGRRLWLGVGVFLLLSAGMWVSSSRTALLAFSAGVLGIIVGWLKRRGTWQPAIARLLVFIGAAIFVVAFAVVPRDSTTALGRALARVPRLESAEIGRFAKELWNRFDYGGAATEMLQEHPLTGVGVGGFHILAPNYIYRAHEGARQVGPDNAQNWWRHQVAELGLIGALPAMGMSLLLLRLLSRSVSVNESTGVSTILRMVLVGIGAASLLGVPTQHPATFFSVCTALFLFSQSIQVPDRSMGGAGPVRGWWIAVFVVAGATAVGQFASAIGELRVPRRNAEFGLPYAYGFSPIEGISEFGETRWIKSQAVTVVPAQRPWYQLTFWHPHARPSVPLTVTIKMNDRVVAERKVAGADATTIFLAMPADRKWVVLEFAARPGIEPYALHVASQWRFDLPAGTPADSIAR